MHVVIDRDQFTLCDGILVTEVSDVVALRQSERMPDVIITEDDFGSAHSWHKYSNIWVGVGEDREVAGWVYKARAPLTVPTTIHVLND